MIRSTLLILAAAVHGLNAQAVDINGITLYEKVEAIERQLLDPFTLNSLVSPCSVNFGDNPNRGEQTSAQWVRIVFHDAITKGIAGPGLGYDIFSSSPIYNMLILLVDSMRPSVLSQIVRRTLGSLSTLQSSSLPCSQALSCQWQILSAW